MTAACPAEAGRRNILNTWRANFFPIPLIKIYRLLALRTLNRFCTPSETRKFSFSIRKQSTDNQKTDVSWGNKVVIISFVKTKFSLTYLLYVSNKDIYHLLSKR